MYKHSNVMKSRTISQKLRGRHNLWPYSCFYGDSGLCDWKNRWIYSFLFPYYLYRVEATKRRHVDTEPAWPGRAARARPHLQNTTCPLSKYLYTLSYCVHSAKYILLAFARSLARLDCRAEYQTFYQSFMKDCTTDNFPYYIATNQEDCNYCKCNYLLRFMLCLQQAEETLLSSLLRE